MRSKRQSNPVVSRSHATRRALRAAASKAALTSAVVRRISSSTSIGSSSLKDFGWRSRRGLAADSFQVLDEEIVKRSRSDNNGWYISALTAIGIERNDYLVVEAIAGEGEITLAVVDADIGATRLSQ